MARTRSDFLTRAPVLSVGGDSDEDDNESVSSPGPRHYTLPLGGQSSTEAALGGSCFSDSDMVTGAEAAAASLSLLTPPPPNSPSSEGALISPDSNFCCSEKKFL